MRSLFVLSMTKLTLLVAMGIMNTISSLIICLDCVRMYGWTRV